MIESYSGSEYDALYERVRTDLTNANDVFAKARAVDGVIEISFELASTPYNTDPSRGCGASLNLNVVDS